MSHAQILIHQAAFKKLGVGLQKNQYNLDQSRTVEFSSLSVPHCFNEVLCNVCRTIEFAGGNIVIISEKEGITPVLSP